MGLFLSRWPDKRSAIRHHADIADIAEWRRRLIRVNHHPHWALAYRVTPFLLQQPLLTGNLIHRNVVRFLSGSNQVLPAVIDVKATRLRFGRLEAFHRQHAAIF